MGCRNLILPRHSLFGEAQGASSQLQRGRTKLKESKTCKRPTCVNLKHLFEVTYDQCMNNFWRIGHFKVYQSTFQCLSLPYFVAYLNIYPIWLHFGSVNHLQCCIYSTIVNVRIQVIVIITTEYLSSKQVHKSKDLKSDLL